jgi:hypothetical protein
VLNPFLRLTVVTAVISAAAFPAKAINLSVSPARIFAKGPPGVSSEVELSVYNGTSRPLPCEVVAQDFGLEAKGKEIIAPAGSMPTSAASWITFHPSKLTLPPKGAGKFKAVISVPANANGGHYALILVKTMVGADVPEGFGYGLSTEMGVKLYHLVEGRSRAKVTLLGKSVQPPTSHEKLVVKLDFINSGDAHTELRADMAVLDADKKLIGKAQIELGPVLLPGQRDELRLEWGGEPKPGPYLAVITVSATEGAEPMVLELPFVAGDAPKQATRKK